MKWCVSCTIRMTWWDLFFWIQDPLTGECLQDVLNLWKSRDRLRLAENNMQNRGTWQWVGKQCALESGASHHRPVKLWPPHHLTFAPPHHLTYAPPRLAFYWLRLATILLKKLKHYKILNSDALCNLFLIWATWLWSGPLMVVCHWPWLATKL